MEVSDPNFLVAAPKKPRTEKQKIATENALKKLQERREGLQKEKEEKKKLMTQTEHKPAEPVVLPTKIKASHKKKKVDYMTKDDMNGFMSRVESLMSSQKAVAVQQGKAEKVAAEAEAEAEVEESSSEEEVVAPKKATSVAKVPKVREVATTLLPNPVPKMLRERPPLTGHALLDNLFFY